MCSDNSFDERCGARPEQHDDHDVMQVRIPRQGDTYDVAAGAWALCYVSILVPVLCVFDDGYGEMATAFLAEPGWPDQYMFPLPPVSILRVSISEEIEK